MHFSVLFLEWTVALTMHQCMGVHIQNGTVFHIISVSWLFTSRKQTGNRQCNVNINTWLSRLNTRDAVISFSHHININLKLQTQTLSPATRKLGVVENLSNIANVNQLAISTIEVIAFPN